MLNCERRGKERKGRRTRGMKEREGGREGMFCDCFRHQISYQNKLSVSTLGNLQIWSSVYKQHIPHLTVTKLLKSSQHICTLSFYSLTNSQINALQPLSDLSCGQWPSSNDVNVSATPAIIECACKSVKTT